VKGHCTAPCSYVCATACLPCAFPSQLLRNVGRLITLRDDEYRGKMSCDTMGCRVSWWATEREEHTCAWLSECAYYVWLALVFSAKMGANLVESKRNSICNKENNYETDLANLTRCWRYCCQWWWRDRQQFDRMMEPDNVSEWPSRDVDDARVLQRETTSDHVAAQNNSILYSIINMRLSKHKTHDHIHWRRPFARDGSHEAFTKPCR
jgi:hypothetical protein